MTQVKSAQQASKTLASTPRARHRTLAQRRADVETQIRASLAADATLALTEPAQLKLRMKQLRKLAGDPPQRIVARALNDTPPRTFQSWENAEVETDRENYEMVAAYYTEKLGRKITANWILFGHDDAPALPDPSATPDLGATFNGEMPGDLRAEIEGLHRKLDELLAKVELLSSAVGALSEADEEPDQEQPTKTAARSRRTRRRATG